MCCAWLQGRCCCCLPLRKGVLLYAYTNILFCAFMIALSLSYTIHHDIPAYLVYSTAVQSIPAALCIIIYCAEVIFNVVLIYGAHTKTVTYIKAYYYFAIVSTLALFGLCILDLLEDPLGFFSIIVVCMQSYLITIVRSLLKKLETDGPHVYDNQLHQIVTGERKLETNGVYNNLTTPAEMKN